MTMLKEPAFLVFQEVCAVTICAENGLLYFFRGLVFSPQSTLYDLFHRGPRVMYADALHWWY